MNFNGSNDTLIKLDRLSFIYYLECSTSLPIIYDTFPSNQSLVLSLDVHSSSRQDCSEGRGILLRCLRPSYINCLSPHCSKEFAQKGYFSNIA